jgi:hypothetical protein
VAQASRSAALRIPGRLLASKRLVAQFRIGWVPLDASPFPGRPYLARTTRKEACKKRSSANPRAESRSGQARFGFRLECTLDTPTFEKAPRPKVLLSIHMQSNRADNFKRFLDRLEESAEDPQSIEVIVKIDDTDEVMNAYLPTEVTRRRCRVKFISTPLPDGFYGLWRSMDEMLAVCAPDAYFIVNLNDEMYFEAPGWDTRLSRYVGLFPDHIFRLRTSSQKFRNYYDFWEPGFANDTSAIMTKRWLDIGGGWCPCNGPDTFQQCVAYYFGWLHRFDAKRPCRELPIHDVETSGSGANQGLTGNSLRRRLRGAVRPWFLLMSHRMQQEAARRAQLLHAHVWLAEHGAESHHVYDNARRRRIEVTNRHDGQRLRTLAYDLSATRISLTNAVRKFNYSYYGGGAGNVTKNWVKNSAEYACLRHDWADKLHNLYTRVVHRLIGIAFDAYWFPDQAWKGPTPRYRFIRATILIAGIWPARLARHPIKNGRRLLDLMNRPRPTQP